jgi:hypothetical protein
MCSFASANGGAKNYKCMNIHTFLGFAPEISVHKGSYIDPHRKATPAFYPQEQGDFPNFLLFPTKNHPNDYVISK